MEKHVCSLVSLVLFRFAIFHRLDICRFVLGYCFGCFLRTLLCITVVIKIYDSAQTMRCGHQLRHTARQTILCCYIFIWIIQWITEVSRKYVYIYMYIYIYIYIADSRRPFHGFRKKENIYSIRFASPGGPEKSLWSPGALDEFMKWHVQICLRWGP